MKNKTLLLIVAAIGCSVAAWVFYHQSRPKQSATESVKATAAPTPRLPIGTRPEAPSSPASSPPEPVAAPPTNAAVNPPVKKSTPTNDAAKGPTIVLPSYHDPRMDDPVFKEEIGRYALSLVGVDPDADQVWIQIIGDPSLSADARQNLIEDLNEDGLSDPKNPGPQDLPVIQKRIQLIEKLSPYAKDQVTQDGLAEAYKDLLKMRFDLTGQ